MRQIYYNPLTFLFHGLDKDGTWWMGCDYYDDAETVNIPVASPPQWVRDELKLVEHPAYFATPVQFTVIDHTAWKSTIWAGHNYMQRPPYLSNWHY